MTVQAARFSSRPFPRDWQLPGDCTGMLLAGGLRGGRDEAYYLLDFDNSRICYCDIDTSLYADGMTRFLQARIAPEDLPYGIRSHELMAYNFAQPHEGLMLKDGRIVVGMHNASYFREINFDQRHVSTFHSDAEFRPVMLSAQNSLGAQGTLYFYAETSMEDRLRRYSEPGVSLRTSVSCVDVQTGRVQQIGSLFTDEAVHEAKLTTDESRVLLTEFSLVARARPPAHQEHVFKETGQWAEYEAAGLENSRLYCVDRSTGAHESMPVSACTPGHIEFSAADPQRFYLSCHNLSKAHGKVILHGSGALIAGRLANTGLEECQKLSNSELFRVTSHKVYEYEGSRRIAVTVFPNRLYILSDPDLSIIENVELFPHDPVPASGLYFCTLLPHMPIWLDTSDNRRYVILVANDSLHVFDQKTSVLRSVRGYSYEGDFAGTAHVTNMKDFIACRESRT